MNDKVFKIMNDPALIQNRDMWFNRLESLFNGEYTGPVSLSGRGGRLENSDIIYTDLQGAVETGLIDLASQIEEAGDKINNYFMPFTLEANWYGVHFIDKILGSHVFFDEKSGQWYNRYLTTPIGELEMPDLDKSEPWYLAKQYAVAFLQLDAELPILGMPVLSSPLNIAINLYGGEFLCAMIEEPEAAHHDLDIINTVIMSLHKWYIDNVPAHRLQPTVSAWRTQPIGFGQLCGCSTHLVSPRLYEEFIMPQDDKLLSLYKGGGMIHLCGSHKHLIPLFREMPHLRSVQLNDLAADQLEDYVKGLREDQVIYFSPTNNMPFEKSLEVSRGKRMVYVGEFEF